MILPHQHQCTHAIEGNFGCILLARLLQICSAVGGEEANFLRELVEGKVLSAMHHHGFVMNLGHGVFLRVIY
jgi:hypothetical protein